MSKSPAIISHLHSSEPTICNLARGMFLEIGENPMREGLVRTPERFQKALRDLTSGYGLTPEAVAGDGIFESESQGIVSVKDIEFYSLCEHHMLPFWGKASIGYVPNDKILGLSKIARVLDVFSRRLQVQERLTKEVADAIFKLVGAKAVAVTIEAQHMCMMMRGVEKQSSKTRTEYMAGLQNLTDQEQSRIWNHLEN